MSRGSPRISMRLTAADQAHLRALQARYGVSDTTTLLRKLLEVSDTPPVVSDTVSDTPKLTADAVLAWWDQYMQPYKSQKWYSAAREALAAQT